MSKAPPSLLALVLFGIPISVPALEATRLVVVSASESVVYESGPAFFEMKNLIASALSTPATRDVISTNVPKYRIVVASKNNEVAYLLTEGWLHSAEGAHRFSDAAFKKLMHIIESRAGQGSPAP
jgi:hypothetical protein